MSNFQEAIEQRVGKIPGYQDTSEPLLEYYSDDTLACHGIRFLDENHAISYFIVPDAICGPSARPPMFDKISFEDSRVKTQTEKGDARNHLNENVVVNGVHIEVVSGHNLAGLAAEAMTQRFNQDRIESADLMLTGSVFVRYNGFVLPEQELYLVGDIDVEENGVTFSPNFTVHDQIKIRAQKFHAAVVDPIDKQTKAHMMTWDWLIETSAQALGSSVASMKGKVPILGQVERSIYSPVPIKAGDLIETHIELSPSPAEQGFGNTRIFVNGEKYGSQIRLMVQFYPIGMIAEGIVNARGN